MDKITCLFPFVYIRVSLGFVYLDHYTECSIIEKQCSVGYWEIKNTKYLVFLLYLLISEEFGRLSHLRLIIY